MKRVLLAVAPFASVSRPALGVSLLRACLQRDGVDCDVRYLSMLFARMLGTERHDRICDHGGVLLFGEWVFARSVFGTENSAADDHFRSVYQAVDGAGADAEGVRALASPFLDRCMKAVDWASYDIVGFSTTFEQNLASLALAQRIKRLDPAKVVVMGGANCEGQMGEELHRRFPFVDYVVKGEADETFPALVKAVREGRPVDDIPGIVYRREGASCTTRPAMPVTDLDGLPYPDFSDYMRQVSAILPAGTCRALTMETSRGCWWGEVSRCAFCGLNGESIRYRSKSAPRALSELCHIVDRYARAHRVPQIMVSDNVLDMRYFHDLVPRMAEKRLPLAVSFEVKSNLRKDQLRALRDASVLTIGPGIESLSTPILRLMRKGVTALQNVQMLKHCTELGVYPSWTILTRFPGEQPEDGRRTRALIPKITHLTPPWVTGPFQLERFSHYFANPEASGLRNVRPISTYALVYPFEPASLSRLAYYFDFDFADHVRPPEDHNEMAAAVAWWKERHRKEYLCASTTPEGALVLQDGRSVARTPSLSLHGVQRDIYEHCDSARPLGAVVARARQLHPGLPIRARDVSDFLHDMVNLDLMMSEGDRFLSLAVPLQRAA